MKNNRTPIKLTIVLSIVLFILTITQFGNLFPLLLPKIENLTFNSTSLGGQFKSGLIFSIIVGLIPILLYFTWRLSPIKKTNKRTLSGLIVLTFMFIAVILRQQIIQSSFDKLTNLKTQSGETIYNSFSIENLHFEYYLFGGLILGCIMSYIILKDK